MDLHDCMVARWTMRSHTSADLISHRNLADLGILTGTSFLLGSLLTASFTCIQLVSPFFLCVFLLLQDVLNKAVCGGGRGTVAVKDTTSFFSLAYPTYLDSLLTQFFLFSSATEASANLSASTETQRPSLALNPKP